MNKKLKIIDLVNKYVPTGGKVLEISCGEGGFQGLKAWGIFHHSHAKYNEDSFKTSFSYDRIF